MKAIRFRDRALQDLEQSALSYEDQERGLGAWFYTRLLDEIESTLGTVGGVHRKRHGMHCFISTRFPYGIYYRIEDNDVSIYAILDLRRNPRVLNRILRNR